MKTASTEIRSLCVRSTAATVGLAVLTLSFPPLFGEVEPSDTAHERQQASRESKLTANRVHHERQALRALFGENQAEWTPASYLDAIETVRSIGDSEHSAHLIELKALMQHIHQRSSSSPLVAECMDALWRLGEDESTFLEWSSAWSSQPMLALHAATVGSRTANPEVASRLLDDCREAAATNSQHHSLFALASTRLFQAQILNETYRNARTMQEKVDIAALASLGTYIPLNSPCSGIESTENRCNPNAYLGRHWLEDLSLESPFECASALLVSTVGGFLDEVASLDSSVEQAILNDMRDHAATYMAPVAQGYYLGRRPTAFQHQLHR